MCPKPSVLSIPPAAPFLETLADALLEGTLLPGFPANQNSANHDPLELCSLTVLLPTRRAVRAFTDIIEARLGGTALLPTIKPIGDVDEDGLILDPARADFSILPAIAPMTRRLALTRLTDHFLRFIYPALRRAEADPHGSHMPTFLDALRSAGDLSRLMDQIQTEEIDWEALEGLIPENYAEYWQQTHRFLEIATRYWPAWLEEQGGALDPAARRQRILDAETARIRARPDSGPIIAAGSTGSIPATARLLKAIAHHPSGAVVLPGLDLESSPAHWDAIAAPGAPAHSHPQYGMARLLHAIGATRDDVRPLGRVDAASAARTTIVNAAMRPAAIADSWSGFRALMTRDQAALDEKAAFADITLLEAPNERREALAIAIALKQALDGGATRVGVVTPDRPLARRIAGEVRRFGLQADDSAGQPLSQTPPGLFARLWARCIVQALPASDLIGLLKHPLAAFGFRPAECRRRARLLEAAILRGPAPASGVDGLRTALRAFAIRLEAGDHRLSPPQKRMHGGDVDACVALIDAIEAALQPLDGLATGEEGEAPLRDWLAAFTESLKRATRQPDNPDGALFAHEAGEALAGFLASLLNVPHETLALPAPMPGEWPGILTELMEAIPVRRRHGGDPRIVIWGPLEARLQDADLLIAAGLNEKSWPQDTRTDPFLSRGMQMQMGLEPPERRIGLAAHDFTQALGRKRVILSRALRQEGAPTVASRWLQRLTALVAPEVIATCQARGAALLDLAERLDTPDGPIRPAARPEPRPPLSARPTSLSVTEIDTLVRDPYAIHARHCLRLEALEPINTAPDASDRGSMIHDVLSAFITTAKGPVGPQDVARFLTLGRSEFAAIEGFPDLHALWWRRFTHLALPYLTWEQQREEHVVRRHSEIRGALDFPLLGFQLRGRADRIDLMRDGSLEIIDFKTGAMPSAAQVQALLAPQLPLEAAMVTAGAFEGIAADQTVSRLLYVQLGSGADPLSEKDSMPGRKSGDGEAPKAPMALAAEARAQLEALIASYQDVSRGYVSRARPQFEKRFAGQYDHLARVKEWGIDSGGDEA